MTTIVALWADTHPNSRTGLCPETLQLDGVGSPGTYQANAVQRECWQHWLEYWHEIAELKRKLKTRIIGVQDGDGSDDNKHDAAGLITANKADMLKIAEAVLQPAREVCDDLIIVRGTPAHVGEQAWSEEILAKLVDATPDKEAGQFSWWYWPAEVEGVKFHVAHRPPTTGQKAWTRDAAVGRASAEVRYEYLGKGEQPPDVAAFGHFHFWRDSGRSKKPTVLFLPPWCVMDAYAITKGKVALATEIGGVWVVCSEGTAHIGWHTWKAGGKALWKSG